MRLMRWPILLFSCACLLAVQIGGLHTHGDADGSLADPAGWHLHPHGLHGHDGHAHIPESDSSEPEYPAERLPAGTGQISFEEMSPGNWTLPELDIHLQSGPYVAAARESHRYPWHAGYRPAVPRRAWGPPPRGPPAQDV